jgi:hypothetical protein
VRPTAALDVAFATSEISWAAARLPTKHLGERERRPPHAGVVSFALPAVRLAGHGSADRLRFWSRARTDPVVRFSAAAIKKTEAPHRADLEAYGLFLSPSLTLVRCRNNVSQRTCRPKRSLGCGRSDDSWCLPGFLVLQQHAHPLGAALSPASSRGPVASGRLKARDYRLVSAASSVDCFTAMSARLFIDSPIKSTN